MKNKELRMNNENYSPMSKLKTIPLSLQASVLPKPFLRPRSLRFSRKSSSSLRFSVCFGSAEALLPSLFLISYFFLILLHKNPYRSPK